ncbi:MAG: T9SS type A sorting domain-containing protein [Bacteroidia bacterium]|nr:T9SS type A sorting domain-containing protein [Bacteroidia bacterium]
MLDSLFVVSWDEGAMYRVLKMDYLDVVSEIPSALDQIPMLKNSGNPFGGPYYKLSAVNDSVFLISGRGGRIYSFLHSFDSVVCVDSMAIQGSWSALDLYRDTIVVVSSESHDARFYYVDGVGRISQSATIEIDRAVSSVYDVFLRHGNLYWTDGAFWYVLLRTPERFKLAPGIAEDWTLRETKPLFGKNLVIIVGCVNDEFWVYDQELNLLCNQSPVVSPGALASGIFGDKVFTANSGGISTWIRDTTTTSIASPSLSTRRSWIEVWPNPSSSGMITVRSDQTTTALDLYDETGRIVFRAWQAGTGVTIIPTAFLPPGIYFINAHTEEGTITERVVLLGTK